MKLFVIVRPPPVFHLAFYLFDNILLFFKEFLSFFGNGIYFLAVTLRGANITHIIKHLKGRVNAPLADIFKQYDTEIRGLWQYYQYALNASKHINHIRYIAECSLVATLAHKLRTKKTTVYRRYSYVGRRKCLGMKTEKGTQITFGDFNLQRSNFRDTKPIYDLIFKEYYGRTELVKRLEKGVCEIDGCENPGEEVHHIRAMKDLNKWKKRGVTPPVWVKSMMAMYRKTLVVCKQHHQEIHQGKLS